jgi:MFS family permease
VPAYLLILLLPVALLMLVPPLPLAVLMLGSAGFTLSIVLANTFWTTMEQQHVPNEALGRVDSISWMVSLVIMPIGFVVTGPVSDAIGVRETLIAAAVIGTASPLAALASSSVRDLRRLEDGEPATAAPGPAAPSA